MRLPTLIHHWKVGIYYVRLSILRQLEYPLSLVSWFLLIPIQSILGVCLLSALGRTFHDIAGWTFPQLMFLYGMALLSHSLFVIFFIPTWNTEDMVIYGRFDQLIVRPLNVFFQFSFQSFNLIGIIDLLPALIIFFAAITMLRLKLDASFLISSAMMIVGGTLIRASIYAILGAAAFWIQKSRVLVMNGYIVLDRVTMYPQTIFPHFVQIILTYFLPIGFISFFPAESLLGKSSGFEFPLPIPILTVCVGLMSFGVALFIFKRGLVRYGSSG